MGANPISLANFNRMRVSVTLAHLAHNQKGTVEFSYSATNFGDVASM